MNKPLVARIVAILIGAFVLFGLELGFGVQFYFAIPAGIFVYLLTLVGLGVLLGTDAPAK